MTNSPLEQTAREDFCFNSSLVFGSLFYQTDISLEWTLSASPKIFLSRKCLYILKNEYKFPDGSITQHKLFSLKVWKESLFRHFKSSSRGQENNSKWLIKEYFFQTTGRVEGRVLESTGNPVDSTVSVIGGGRGSAEGIPHDQLHKDDYIRVWKIELSVFLLWVRSFYENLWRTSKVEIWCNLILVWVCYGCLICWTSKCQIC